MTPTTTAHDLDDDDDDDDFMLTEIESDLYLCRERYYQSFNVANIWIVRGSESDLIIDTGIGLWDLPTFLKRKRLINHPSPPPPPPNTTTTTTTSTAGQSTTTTTTATTMKPYQAVATHVHFDHAGGLHQFDDDTSIAIHEEEAGFLSTGDSYAACCYMSRSEIKKPPSDAWSPMDYKLRPTTPTNILHDGDVFDLGNKQLRVLHLPGHSRGSIGLFDENNGHLFCGDIAGNFPSVDWLPYGNVEDMIQTMTTLQNLAPRIKRVFPGHGDPIDGTQLEQITQNYLNNAGRCHDCTSCIVGTLASILLQGRNTTKAASGPRCCYRSCCCCLCMG